MNPQNSKPCEALLCEISERARVLDGIAATRQLADETAAIQKDLEFAADLRNEAAMQQIVRCQAITSLSPRRIAALEDQLTGVERRIVAGCIEFIRAHLSPRVSRLKSAAERQAREHLRQHIGDVKALEVAVAAAANVVAADRLRAVVAVTANPVNGPVAYAEDLLTAWSDCDALEARLAQ